MKHIFLNLKRFDITPEHGGVNRLAEPAAWGEAVTSSIKDVAARYTDAEFAAFLPEVHLIGAVAGAAHGQCRGTARLHLGAYRPLRGAHEPARHHG